MAHCPLHYRRLGLRIIVTGSRDWATPEKVWTNLDAICVAAPVDTTYTIVHGDCPTGADRFAREWCEHYADFPPELFGVIITEERHPAEWERYGKRAGFLRNAAMIELGADVVLAFIRNDSKGASMTAKLAERTGIPVLYWRETT
ncbi:SLOG family protein [Micromonospora salmantinae]|uniref:SLOG family protein n=1 Tax=Micromonospora salmantinae TaxID=2911211 RepID=UPI003556D379